MENITADMKQFHTLHPNKKLTILGIIFIVFISSIILGVYLTRNQQNPATTDQNNEQNDLPNSQDTTEDTSASSTLLSLSPASSSIAVGSATDVSVMIEKSPVQAVDIVIMFDPLMFEASNIVNGDVYEDVLIKKIEKGKVTVSAAVSPSDPTNLKTGTLFSFSLKALKAGTGQLEFDAAKTITAKNGINTVGTTQPVNIIVK